MKKHLASTLCILLGSITLALAQAPAGRNLTLLIEQARTQLQSNQNAEALQTAQMAVRQAPNDYRSHYYLGLALLATQRYAEANQSAQKALQLAPAAARPNVQALQAEISKRSQGGDLLKQADQAMAEGLNAKAARLYEQAWQANPSAPDLALKAAVLYREKLNQAIDAGRLFWQVKQAHPNRPESQTASTYLRDLQPLLDEQAKKWLQDAMQQSPEDAWKTMGDIRSIAPNLNGLANAEAIHSARGTDQTRLRQSIKALENLRLASPANIGRLPRMAEWLEQADFDQYLKDLFGNGFPDQIRNAQRLDQKYQQDMVEYQRKLDEFNEKTQIRKAQYDKCFYEVIDRRGGWQACREEARDKSLTVNGDNTYAGKMAICESQNKYQADSECRQRYPEPWRPVEPKKPN